MHPSIATVFYPEYVWDCGGLQVQKLFTTRACYQPAPNLQEAYLLFVLLHCSTQPRVVKYLEGAGSDILPPGLGRVSAAGPELPC